VNSTSAVIARIIEAQLTGTRTGFYFDGIISIAITDPKRDRDD
jgi:hypothetical protein